MFEFKATSNGEVSALLKALDNKTSAGTSGIPVSVLKTNDAKFTPIFVRLFNDCLKQKCIPNDWKAAIVTPLYKNKGESNDLNNFRGISVLPLFRSYSRKFCQ